MVALRSRQNLNPINSKLRRRRQPTVLSRLRVSTGLVIKSARRVYIINTGDITDCGSNCPYSV